MKGKVIRDEGRGVLSGVQTDEGRKLKVEEGCLVGSSVMGGVHFAWTTVILYNLHVKC